MELFGYGMVIRGMMVEIFRDQLVFKETLDHKE